MLVTDEPATGTMTITWPDASTSKVRAKFLVRTKVGGHGTKSVLAIAGKVRRGTYEGDRVSAATNHILTQGSCVKGPDAGPITQTSFFAYGNFHNEKLLTFSH